MTKEELEKEASEFEKNYTIYEVAKREDGTDYAKKVCKVTVKEGYLAGAEPREKRIEELENEIEQLQRINSEQKETLKKVRIALIQERTANIMNYGKGGVEMFDDMLEVLKSVSN